MLVWYVRIVLTRYQFTDQSRAKWMKKMIGTMSLKIHE